MSNDPMRHIRRHYEITGHSFGGRSPYPISKSVGDTVLHPDGRVTPTPAPDAGHAAETMNTRQNAIADALWTLGITKQLIAPDLANDIIGYMLNQYDVAVIETRWLPGFALQHTAPARTAGTETGGEQ